MLMRSLLTLAWSSLGSRRFVALLTVACIGLGSAVLIVVEQIRMEAREAFTRSVSGVDLIVGPRGGSVELLMGVVFRTGTPGRGMTFESYRQIAALPGVTWALPVSFGDSHHGYPVMGTEADYFKHFRYGRSQPLTFAAGNPFADIFDAVIGAEVAERLGYQLNQQIALEHGLEAAMDAEHSHQDKPFRIVGILQRTGTAVDRTVHVSLAGIEAMHADWVDGRPPDAFDKLSAEEARLVVKAPERISAMLVALDQRAAALFMQARLGSWPAEPLSAVMPGPALARTLGDCWRGRECTAWHVMVCDHCGVGGDVDRTLEWPGRAPSGNGRVARCRCEASAHISADHRRSPSAHPWRPGGGDILRGVNLVGTR